MTCLYPVGTRVVLTTALGRVVEGFIVDGSEFGLWLDVTSEDGELVLEERNREFFGWCATAGMTVPGPKVPGSGWEP